MGLRTFQSVSIPTLGPLRPLSWRLMRSGAADGATNMATDLALLDHARRTGEATLRVYAWRRPTLSLGRNERARGTFDVRALRTAGVEVVRRPTGGRALLHDHEVTYSVTAPVGTTSLGEAFHAINALLLDGLHALGVPVTAVTERADGPLRPDGAACFATPGVGELVVAGAKLVGSAQWRDAGALLQHGSILLADDQPRIAALRAPGSDAPAAVAPAATLAAALGRPVGREEVESALADALHRGLGAAPTPLDPALFQRDLARHLSVLADPNWTWRR